VRANCSSAERVGTSGEVIAAPVENPRREQGTYNASSMSDGHGLAQQTKVQEGKEHPAVPCFKRGFGDDQDETDQTHAALG